MGDADMTGREQWHALVLRWITKADEHGRRCFDLCESDDQHDKLEYTVQHRALIDALQNAQDYLNDGAFDDDD
jgi:hypothetical protein